MRVSLLERGPLPRDKPCGEGLLPRGMRLLDEMGARVADGRPFDGIVYLDERLGLRAEGRFGPGTGRGLGARRTELSRALLERALAVGVVVHERTRAESIEPSASSVRVRTPLGPVEGRFLVGADGLHSRVRELLGGVGAGGSVARRRRYGYRRHYRAEPWSRFVEVHWGGGGEAYVTPVSDSEVGVAFLFDLHENGRAPSFDGMLRRFPALEARLHSRAASATTIVKGAGPFRQEVGRIASKRVALVGDAAGYLDALTGEGLALGFESARALVDVLVRGDGMEAYERAHRSLSRRYYAMTKLVLTLASHPRLRAHALRLLAARPGLFARLLAFLDGGDSGDGAMRVRRPPGIS